MAILILAGGLSKGRAADTHAPGGVTHHIKTVFIILMENHNWTGDGDKSIEGKRRASYINDTLIPMGSHAEQYYNPPGVHPSLPNYLWLEAGTNFGILHDGLPRKFGQDTTDHLVSYLDKAGVNWKAYLENAPRARCPLKNEGGTDASGSPNYAVRHEPFAYFNDVTDNHNEFSAKCIAHLRPFRELARDLRKNKVASYNFITPNQCDDMHDGCKTGAVRNGDQWLAANVPMILNSKAYKDGGALFITFDEADKGDGPIPMIVISPFAKGHGYSNDIPYTHGSTLRTMQEIFGVTPLLGDAANQTDLSDLFTTFP
ncbi:MAG TPA: alkaline phosphatase family protein [Rhizomicrobium sp.]|nr:alkaline phosphatase family protein [Rhizomicrobium sp.]